MAGGESRNQMMQNLFGDQSEDDEEEDEEDDEEEDLDNAHAAGAAAAADGEDDREPYQSDEGEGEADIDIEGEGQGEVEGQGEIEVESEGEHGANGYQEESEGERVQSSPEREASDHKMESQQKNAESEEQEEDEEEGYGQRVVSSRRRDVVASESEESENNVYAHGDEDEEDDNMRREPIEQKDNEVVRDVFGESDEDEQAEYDNQNDVEQDEHRSPMEEEDGYEKGLRPEDIVPDEDGRYESEEENIEQKGKEKPIGPPLEMEIPLRPPPSQPKRMNLIRVSNIMGIEPKPFDPKTYVEEDVFVTDESGTKKRIRLEDNIVRWRSVRNRDGTISYESNARFVRWSDGSLQLLIGNEVLDTSVNEAHHDQMQLFLRHGKGIMQSQGKLLQKMRFMPSSLSSKSHRLLTALVDSRHKKVYKVKNCITNIDPEREKEEKVKAEGQTIRANELLNRKREKISRKYATPVERGRQLTPGFLEDALEEDEDNEDYYSSRRGSARRRFEEDMEVEARAEKRIMNAKKSHLHKEIPRKPSLSAGRSSRRQAYSESEQEESEYETDGEDIETSPPRKRDELPDDEDEYEEEEEEEEEEAEEDGGANTASEVEEQAPRPKIKESGKRKEMDFDEDSPPRKQVHRRKAIVFDSDEE